MKKKVVARSVKKPRFEMLAIGQVTEGMCKEKQMEILHYLKNRANYSGITLYINSCGGSLGCAFAIYDMLKSINTSVYTVALGDCMSSASVLFCAGEKRFCGKNADLLIHGASVPADEYINMNETKIAHARLTHYNQRMKDIFLSLENITDKVKEYIDAVFENDKEVLLDAKEVISCGFATDLYEEYSDVK